jgi:hypothetical protein
MRLPPEMNSTNSVITRPMPVRVTVPTTMPAADVATPMPIMLRAPLTNPVMRSSNPVLKLNSSPFILRKMPLRGRWVRTMNINSTVAQ